jgi:hypothetical protein
MSVSEENHGGHTYRNQDNLRNSLAQGRAPLHLRHQIADGDVDEA